VCCIESIWNIYITFILLYIATCVNFELQVENFVNYLVSFCCTEKLIPSASLSIASTLLAHSDAGMKQILYLCYFCYIILVFAYLICGL